MFQTLTRLVLVMVGAGLLWAPGCPAPAAAQDAGGAICLVAYADTNSNGVRDTGEGALAGANFNLATDGVIVGTHITTGSDAPYCFENLSPATYTLTLLESPTYRITTAAQDTYTLASGEQRPAVAFGAVPVPLQNLGSTVDADLAQAAPGAICVATYADTNGNGNYDPDLEGPLVGVNVNLATQGQIIATHISGEADEYCFENLQPGVYTVTFAESLTYRPTTANAITFELPPNTERMAITAFGAVPVPVENLRAEAAARSPQAETGEEPLDTSARLLLATTGSMAVMIFMIGVGAVILGTAGGSRRRRPRGQR